eukprot:13213086-Alexandrium_andersonii.AAC.1
MSSRTPWLAGTSRRRVSRCSSRTAFAVLRCRSRPTARTSRAVRHGRGRAVHGISSSTALGTSSSTIPSPISAARSTGW